MPDCPMLLAIIIASYNFDFAHCIVEKIHEQALRRSTSIPFPFLVYRLYIDMGTEIIPNVDLMIDVHRTQDVDLIKADENPIEPK